jgi:hypothetical protein
MKTLPFVVSLVGLALGGARSPHARRLTSAAQAAIPSPHHRAEGEDVLEDVGPDIKIVEAGAPAFDRSSNPRAATRYAFDVKKRALVAARSFTE